MHDLDLVHQYELIVPTTEKILKVFQLCANDDPLRKKAVLPTVKSVSLALDKIRTFQLADSLGISVPSSTLILQNSEIPSCDEFPVVLKTRNSQTRVGNDLVYASVCIASTLGEYESYFEKWIEHTAIQQQKYFYGTGIGIEFLYVNGIRRLYFAHERIHELPLTGGASSYRRSIDPTGPMLAAATKLLDNLDWHGLAMVEFKVAANGDFVLLEINPRPWGSMALSVKAGANFPFWLYEVAKNGDAEILQSYRLNFYARNLQRDVIWIKENIIADHNNNLLLVRNRVISFFEWFRPVLGNESWDHFDWQDLGPMCRQISALFFTVYSSIKKRITDLREVWNIRRQHYRNIKRMSKSSFSKKSVLFLCYGNICRSPMSEVVAKQYENGIFYGSSGFHETVGRPSPARIIRIAETFDIDISGHRSSCVDAECIKAADIIVVMDNINCQDLAFQHPSAIKKMVLLGMFSNKGKKTSIPDPYSLSEENARKSIEMVVECTRNFVKWQSGF